MATSVAACGVCTPSLLGAAVHPPGLQLEAAREQLHGLLVGGQRLCARVACVRVTTAAAQRGARTAVPALPERTSARPSASASAGSSAAPGRSCLLPSTSTGSRSARSHSADRIFHSSARASANRAGAPASTTNTARAAGEAQYAGEEERARTDRCRAHAGRSPPTCCAHARARDCVHSCAPLQGPARAPVAEALLPAHVKHARAQPHARRHEVVLLGLLGRPHARHEGARLQRRHQRRLARAVQPHHHQRLRVAVEHALL